jgi:signal transduction histidine kinase
MAYFGFSSSAAITSPDRRAGRSHLRKIKRVSGQQTSRRIGEIKEESERRAESGDHVHLLSSFAVKRRFTVGISSTLRQMLSRLDGQIHSLITLPLICAQGLQRLPMQQSVESLRGCRNAGCAANMKHQPVYTYKMTHIASIFYIQSILKLFPQSDI